MEIITIQQNCISKMIQLTKYELLMQNVFEMTTGCTSGKCAINIYCKCELKFLTMTKKMHPNYFRRNVNRLVNVSFIYTQRLIDL